MYDFFYNNLGELESVRRSSDGATVWVRGNNPLYTVANPLTAAFLLTNPDLTNKPDRAFTITVGSGTATSGGSSVIPVGSNPAVIVGGADGSVGATLAAPSTSTLSFAPITARSGSPVEMRLSIAGNLVATVAMPSDYLNPQRAFSFFNGPNSTTYTGVIAATNISLS